MKREFFLIKIVFAIVLLVSLVFPNYLLAATFTLDCLSGTSVTDSVTSADTTDILEVSNAPSGTVITFDYVTSSGNKTIEATSGDANVVIPGPVTLNGNTTGSQITTVTGTDSMPSYTVILMTNQNNRFANWTATCTSLATANLQLAKTWVNGVVGNAITATTSGLTNNASVSSTSSGSNTDTGIAAVVTIGEVATLDTESFTTGSAASYTTSDWICDDAASSTVAAGSSLTIAAADAGSTITCTVTNTFIPQAVDLKITKTVDDTTPNIGDTLTFSLLVENLGPGIATDILVTDIIPAGFTYVADSMTGISPAVANITPNQSSPAGTGLQWTISTLLVVEPPPIDNTVTLTFQSIVNPP